MNARAGPLWRAELDRTGRSWGFNYSLNGIDEEFVSEAGFVNRTGIVSARAFNRLTWYGARGGLVETVTTFFGPSRVWRHDGFLDEAAIEGEEELNTTVRLRGGWEAEARLGRGFVQLDPLDYSGLSVLRDDVEEPYSPLDEVSGLGLELSLETPTFQAFDARLDLETGRVAIFPEGSEGTGRAIELDVNLRPARAVRVFLTTAYEQLARRRDGSEFARTIIPRLLVEFQPTRAFFVRALGEYRAERRAALRDARTGQPLLFEGEPIGAEELNGVRVDLLAAYEPSPGTVAYLGYGATLNDGAAFRFAGMERATDGLFLKIAYQFRR
jgi:hypothetical protein